MRRRRVGSAKARNRQARPRPSGSTRPWPAGCFVAQPPGQEASRRRSARSRWIGAAWANRPSWRSSSARSAGGRSIRLSRSPSTPASASAQSRWRPTIHDAVSLRPGSAEASSPATNLGSSPPPSIWSSATIAALAVRVVLARQPGLRRLRIGDLDQGISERMFENAIVGPAGGLREARARPTCRRFAPGPRRRRGGSGPTATSSSSISRGRASGHATGP